MSTKYSVGAMNQLGDALELAAFTPEEVSALRNFPHWSRIRDVIRGKAEISYPQRLIDCDADPFVPDGWAVESHAKGGQLMFDRAKIRLYLSKAQEKGKPVEGNKLRKELADQPVLNANVLEYLLVHPELIPDEWKGKCVFFWGTIYRYSNGHLYVRYLDWDDVRWFWHIRWLDDDCFTGNLAIILASN